MTELFFFCILGCIVLLQMQITKIEKRGKIHEDMTAKNTQAILEILEQLDTIDQ